MSEPLVDHLDLAALPVGEVSRQWLRMGSDGLGRPVCVPILATRGPTEGPVVVLTAAVHGNEVNGVRVIHRVFERLGPSRLAGTLIGVPVVNVPAYHAHTRLTPEGFDLNHQFPGRPDGHTASSYAHRLVQRVARHADALIDLHTASAGRVNCLYVRADLDVPRVRRLAWLQRPQIIVHSPPNDATLRGTCDGLGIDAITVEVGNPSRFQPRYIDQARGGIRAVLAELGMLPRKRSVQGDAPLVCSHSYWLYTDEGGLLDVQVEVTDRVQAGQTLATLVDAFGRVVRTYTAPEDAVIIGHSVDPVATSGSRIVHLGVLAAEDSPLRDRPLDD